MKKNNIIYFSVLGLASISVSVYISLNAPTLKGAIINAVILTVLLLVNGTLIFKIVTSLGKWTVRKTVIHLSILFITVFISIVVAQLNMVVGVITSAGIPHFRTNIFTGKCELHRPADRLDPWYFRPDCDIPKAEKVAIIKNDPQYPGIIRACGSRQPKPIWSGVDCADLAPF
jgi:hypothetical protein